MPIGTIITQPAANSINAAYRPVIIRTSATRTDADPRPPVVYCDIYFNDVFYKTLSKSKNIQLNVTDSEWQFDIQDAAQEYLGKFLADNGESTIVEATPIITKALCKLRSSGYDSDGFIVQEDTAPVQGTGDTPPTSGTGTSTNTFYIVNATLQHEDNQDMADHLDTFKNGTWASDTWPLSHRPNHYRICPQDSDSFPIIHGSEVALSSLVLHYQECGETEFTTVEELIPCIAVSIVGSPVLPDATVDEPFSYSFEVAGTAPFELGSIVKPGWMTISISGTTVSFSGTPTGGDVGTGIAVGFDIQNCAGHGSGSPSSSGMWGGDVSFDDTIDVVEAAACTPVTISGGAPAFPDIILGDTYDFDITLLGDAPFALSNVIKPSWMTIEVTGSTIHVGGTPDSTNVGNDIPVSFTISNCNGDIQIAVSDTINVTLVSYSCGGLIAESTFSNTVVNVGRFALGVTGSAEINLHWNVLLRPNRFILYKDGVVAEDTSWRGLANYAGPWGANLNTALTGTINFTVDPGSVYELEIWAGNADPNDLMEDTFTVDIECIDQSILIENVEDAETAEIDDVEINDISVTFGSGDMFPLSGGQSMVAISEEAPGNVKVDVIISGAATVADTVRVTDSNGADHDQAYTGAGTYTFNTIPMNSSLYLHIQLLLA